MTKLAGSAALLLLLAPLSRASAEEGFVGEGKLVLSAERLFGLVVSSSTTDTGGGSETTTHATSISLLWSGGRIFTNYSMPRIALDGFVTDGVSLGAALGLTTVSTSTSVEGGGGSTDRDGPSVLGILVAPRVGYALMLGDTIGLWPRAGITFVRGSTEAPNGDELSGSRLAVTVEGLLVIAIAAPAGILLGPTLDLGIAGSDEETDGPDTTERDITSTDIGIQAALALSF